MIKVAEHHLEGHPDKICDQIADAILDEFVRRDEKTRADISVFGGHGAVMISGEVMSKADFDCAEIAKRVYRDIGYEDEVEPFVHLGAPPSAWQEGVSKNAPIDRALCTGFAAKATREFLSPANVFASLLAEKIDEARRHDANMNWLRPDGSVWVGMDGNRVTSVGIFCQHTEGALVQQVYGGVLDRIIRPVIGNVDGVKLFVNSGGSFVEGGFKKTVGQSGSAIASDLYGGLLLLGMGGLSGKDGSHPLRAGTYMARHIEVVGCLCRVNAGLRENVVCAWTG